MRVARAALSRPFKSKFMEGIEVNIFILFSSLHLWNNGNPHVIYHNNNHTPYGAQCAKQQDFTTIKKKNIWSIIYVN